MRDLRLPRMRAGDAPPARAWLARSIALRGRPLTAFADPLVVHAILALFVVISLFPVYLMFNASLKTQAELFRHTFALPIDPRWHNFLLIFWERGYYKNFINSIILAGSTTIFTLVLSVLAGYAFALCNFFGKQALFLLILIGLMVSEISVLIPVYNLLKDLALLNTYVGLILPQTALGLSFGIFLVTTFFREIPKELVEAAVCDGCTDLQVLWHVIIPVGMPALKALALIEFLWAWNSFFFPLVIATQQDLMPLSVAIIDFMGRFTFNYELIATTCVIMFTPILVMYLFSQASFRRGITFGALK
jgi:ABC-type glycerol-3-phosphate transport system permease component